MISISGGRRKRNAFKAVTTKKFYFKRITYYECVFISLHFRGGIINETLVRLESISQKDSVKPMNKRLPPNHWYHMQTSLHYESLQSSCVK
jgi:hypothetical protein